MECKPNKIALDATTFVKTMKKYDYPHTEGQKLGVRVACFLRDNMENAEELRKHFEPQAKQTDKSIAYTLVAKDPSSWFSEASKALKMSRTTFDTDFYEAAESAFEGIKKGQPAFGEVRLILSPKSAETASWSVSDLEELSIFITVESLQVEMVSKA